MSGSAYEPVVVMFLPIDDAGLLLLGCARSLNIPIRQSSCSTAQAGGESDAGDATQQHGGANQGSQSPEGAGWPMGKDQDAEDRGNYRVKDEPSPSRSGSNLEAEDRGHSRFKEQHHAQYDSKNGHPPKRMREQHQTTDAIHNTQQKPEKERAH